MEFLVDDFNDAGDYFAAGGQSEWADISQIISAMPLFFQASDQKGKVGDPIFDPKATNAFLAAEAVKRGWSPIPVPEELTQFGVDWDGGKNSTLAEWQFSNYPFLWNNIIRTEAVMMGGVHLPGMSDVLALIVVTKSGVFPASNSTLYFEQAVAQVKSVTRLGTFSIPIRLVGLTIPEGCDEVQCTWTDYANTRYDRAPAQQGDAQLSVEWKPRPRKYGTPNARFVRS